MVRWIRLAGSQYFGFWALGLLFFALQELPYMVMPLIPLEANPIMNMGESSAALDRWEKILGSLCIALMTFLVRKDAALFSVAEPSEKLFFTLAMAALLLNFMGWALYFTGRQSVFVMMFFLVALPPLYYVLIGLWRKNIPLAAAGGLFLAVHFIHVWRSLPMGGG